MCYTCIREASIIESGEQIYCMPCQQILSGPHRPASEMPLIWPFAGAPMMSTLVLTGICNNMVSIEFMGFLKDECVENH